MNIRCVVTGRTPAGKSVFANDAAAEPITLDLLPGFQFHRLWGADSPPQLPSDGTPPPHPRYFPPLGGFRFGFFSLPPNTEKLAGMAEVLEPMHPGMPTTDTVDFDVIVSGEVYLQLDDGAEVHLQAGDCVVQNGTRHAWHNRSSQPCVIAVTLIGAHNQR